MATVSKWTPFGVALDITATGGTVTRISATQYTVVINASWETYYSGAQTNYGMSATSGGVTKTISSFGTKRSSGSGSFTGTYSISGNGSATKTITVTFKNFNSDNGDSATKPVTFSVSVPAWTSYTVKYNANGGSGAPSSQTKWKDQTLKLSTTKPTRTGYSFLGWATSSTATSATYSAGGNYTANSGATLYAVWKANTYTVAYNANGGTGAPANQIKTYGKTLTLSSTKPTRANYTFKGWGTSASATTVAYAAGASYTANAAITLHAIWELAYKKPRITNVSIARCDSNGTKTEGGTYCSVKFNYSCDKAPSNVAVSWFSSDGKDSQTLSYTALSATVNAVVGGSFSIEKSYTITVVVEDAGGVSYVSRTINSQKFTIDCLPENKGIAFGKAAELADYAEFGFKAKFINNVCIYGTKPGTTTPWEAFNPVNASGNTVIGYDNFKNTKGKSGLTDCQTNMYGADLTFGITNVANADGTTFRPYRRRGDTLTFTFRGAGYVTNGGKDVSFWIPISAPIVGSPKATAASGNGFILRQGDGYTHGSTASVYVHPTTYEAAPTVFGGIYIKAVFAETTNVTNNDTIGIYWNGTITLS